MSFVQLPGTPLQVSRLGFGCNRLLGPQPRREALRLLDVAYDAGIRHFDVARAYGFGDAEGVLGEFLRTKPRGSCTVTTKFGLAPNPTASKLRWAVGLARRLMRLTPKLRAALGKQARSMIQATPFTPEACRASLETSLRALGVDCIDLYLLHEPTLEDSEAPGLVDFLEAATREGKIRCFGVGGAFVNVARIAASGARAGRVLQFENSVLARNNARLAPQASPARLTYGAVGALARVRSLLNDDAARTRAWSERLGVDCSDPARLSELLLKFALDDNPSGCVLFSTTRSEAIRSNAELLRSLRVTAEQARTFATLVSEALNPEEPT